MAEVGEVGLSMAEVGEPSLSAETFNALAEFYREQEERELRQAGGAEVGDVELPEDWQFSQFWYSPATAAASSDTTFSLMSAPEGLIGNWCTPTIWRGGI